MVKSTEVRCLCIWNPHRVGHDWSDLAAAANLLNFARYHLSHTWTAEIIIFFYNYVVGNEFKYSIKIILYEDGLTIISYYDFFKHLEYSRYSIIVGVIPLLSISNPMSFTFNIIFVYGTYIRLFITLFCHKWWVRDTCLWFLAKNFNYKDLWDFPRGPCF